jgi:YD repeat-containing protein
VTYGYDFEERMTSAGDVTMVYDGDGNRVSRTSGGVTTRFLVDDLTPTGYAQVAEELVSGAITVRYTLGVQHIEPLLADVLTCTG